MTVSVVIVAFGDDPRVDDALRSVRAQDIAVSCVVVHNAVAEDDGQRDADGTVHLRNRRNLGFAAGFNLGFQAGDGDFVLSLNPDAQLALGALSAALQALHADAAIGAVALRLVRPDGITLDGAGIRMDWLRRGRDRGIGKPARGAFEEAQDVDAACMAAALFRREALLAARDGAGQVLDARFFAYKEDVDLGWRLRRAGWRVRYVPEARATHERGWKEGARRQVAPQLRALSLGNRWLTIFKNESLLNALLRTVPWIVQELLLAGWLLLREPRTLLGYWHALRGLRGSLCRRKLRGKSAP
ncbi:MAG: glycosyltransferase family 2 protein [Planctomycetes bacterium]|nr:glycosyltransferase family 2 protein [Planctomycetota bacterium]